MITKISRGSIEVQVGDRTVTILGEGLLRTKGLPDFVLYQDSIEYWEGPEKEPIDPVTRKAILAAVLEEMQQRGMRVAVE